MVRTVLEEAMRSVLLEEDAAPLTFSERLGSQGVMFGSSQRVPLNVGAAQRFCKDSPPPTPATDKRARSFRHLAARNQAKTTYAKPSPFLSERWRIRSNAEDPFPGREGWHRSPTNAVQGSRCASPRVSPRHCRSPPLQLRGFPKVRARSASAPRSARSRTSSAPTREQRPEVRESDESPGNLLARERRQWAEALEAETRPQPPSAAPPEPPAPPLVPLCRSSSNSSFRRQPFHKHMPLKDVDFMRRSASERSAAGYLRAEWRSPLGNDWILPLEILAARQAKAEAVAAAEEAQQMAEEAEAEAEHKTAEEARQVEQSVQAALDESIGAALDEAVAAAAYDLYVERTADGAWEGCLAILMPELIEALADEADKAIQREAFEAYAAAEREKKEKLLNAAKEEEEKAKRRAEVMAQQKAMKQGRRTPKSNG